MKSFVWCIGFSALITWGIVSLAGTMKSTEHQNVYYNVGQIYGLGQCTSDNKCSFQYTDKFGANKSAISDTPVFLGQLVYQECWYEEAKGDRCYVDYQPAKN